MIDVKSRVTVTESGCWIWNGARTGSGYPQMTIGGKAQTVHRLQYRQARGPIPAGHVVCHSCDNKLCVNPDHLFCGTQKSNMQDMKAKGRHLYGERSPRAKLSESQVRAILADPRKLREISQQYNITMAAVSAIRKRKIWKHIKE